jgi:hypothetical protein
MKLIVFGAGGAFAFALLGLWLMTQIRYRIGSRHLKIVLLGMVVRKIDLADIKRISKRPPRRGLAEWWRSTFKTSHRVLTVQRYTGLRKNVVITPRNRYVFLADLQNAVKRVKPNAVLEIPDEDEPDETNAAALDEVAS